jgi:hypothetical protein
MHWGTAFAGAHVAAAVSLAQDVNESLYGQRLSNTALKALLKNTGEDIVDNIQQDMGGTTPTGKTFKRLDVEAMAVGAFNPTATDLFFESDWGLDEWDDITGDTTPSFIGTAPANWHAWLYIEDMEVTSAPVSSSGVYLLTAPAQGLGTKNYSVKFAENSLVTEPNRSTPTTALPVTIVETDSRDPVDASVRVRMSEDFVVSGDSVGSSSLEVDWGVTPIALSKGGTGTIVIDYVDNRTVDVNYTNDGGTTQFDVNTGTVNNAAASNWTVNVNASNVIFNSQVQNLAKLHIQSGGVATIAYTDPVIPPGATEIPYKVLHLRELVIAGTDINPTGKLDITNNALIIDYVSGQNPEVQIRKWILAGRGTNDLSPTWTGNGITSSTAAGNPSGRAVGYADNGSLPLGAYTVWVGYTVDDTSVLVRYTVWGDTNLDGTVDDADVTVQSA